MTDPVSLIDLIDGFQKSQIVIAAVRLGIFDGARPPGPELQRLLEACASLELLEKREAEFVNTAIADEYLRSSSPRSLSGYVRFVGESLYLRWADLEQAVTEGKEQVNPLSLQGIFVRARRRFKDSGAPRDLNRDFNAGMHGLGMLSSPAIAGAFDLSAFRSLVDLGGATGHLALAIGERYPEMKIAVFERPHVIPVTREYTREKAALYPGDLFAGPLPPADLYSLGKVFHNCDESACHRLARRIYEALPTAGAFLVAERILDDDRRGPAHVLASSLNMLVSTKGRERTFPEFRELLLGAGFAAVQYKKTGALVDAILATK